MKHKIFILIALIHFLVPPGASLAVSKEDLHSINYDTVFYEKDTSEDCISGNIPSSVSLPKAIVDQINKNKDVYVEAGRQTNIPWQMLAGIHYRETNLQLTNPANGYGVYQFTPPPKPYPAGQVSQEDFLKQSIDAGNFIKGKLGSVLPNHQAPLSADSSNPEQIKDLMFSYNGRAQAYADQAATLGFNSQKQPYEGSPYVMNNYDSRHKSMGIITRDGGGIDGKDSRYGAFVIYAALAGVDGGACSASSGSSGVVKVARQELAKNVKESPDGCNCGGEIDKYTDNSPEFWCADFVSWIYKEAGKPFTGGSSGGWRLPAVSSIAAWLKENGSYTENGNNASPPKPGDVIDFNHSGDESGNDTHIGIVEKVDSSTVTTIEGNSSNSVARRTYTNYKSDPTIRGWGRPN